MANKITITSDVLAVLTQAIAIEGNHLRITEDLDRALYQRTNDVLSALGGKWTRKVKAHVFPGVDPAAVLYDAIEAGSVAHPNADDFFGTPTDLGEEVVEEAQIEEHHRILEPSAGEGALADIIVRRARGLTVGRLWLIEKNEQRRARLLAKGYGPYLLPGVMDFMTTMIDSQSFIGRFDRVVMNPPFSKRQDVAHVTLAASLLRPGGKLVAIMSAGAKFRSDSQAVAFRSLVEAWGGSFTDNAPDAFKSVGTGVRTVTLSLRRPT